MDDPTVLRNQLQNSLSAPCRKAVKAEEVINRQSAECCLCTEMATREFPSDYRRAYPVESRICVETQDFVVLPTISPMCVGHVLLLPRTHVTRLADLPDRQRETVSACAEHAANRLRERFGDACYFFEHGVITGGMACGIDHAHLHILPLPRHLVNSIESRVEADFPMHTNGSLNEVLEVGAQPQQCYLLHGANPDSIRMSFDNRIPSQYMRKVIAEISGVAEWDWKLLSSWPEFDATQQALR